MHVKRILIGFFVVFIGIVMLAPEKTMEIAEIESEMSMDKVTGQVVSGLTDNPLDESRLKTLFDVLPFILITIGAMTIINSSRMNIP